MKAAVLTAVYDDYDSLKVPALQDGLGIELDFVCVTDAVGALDMVPGWRVIHEPSSLHPNRAAKFPKMMPWAFADADFSIWVDASFKIESPRFVFDLLSMVTADDCEIAQFVHPWRDCIYDEAKESALLPKYDGEPVIEQVQHYRKQGHPEHWGLWATGVIARKHTAAVMAAGLMWLDEIGEWSFQDQLSEPYVLRETGLRPASLAGSHFENPWLSYEGSGRH